MRAKTISKTLLSLRLVFVLASAITQVHGGSPESSGYSTSAQGFGMPATIHSHGDVTRGQTGLFTINIPGLDYGVYVNFSVSGTAIRGVDYVQLVSPVYTRLPSRGIPVHTLPDPRGSIFGQAYSVVVTLRPGIGYTVGEPSSAKMMINPSP